MGSGNPFASRDLAGVGGAVQRLDGPRQPIGVGDRLPAEPGLFRRMHRKREPGYEPPVPQERAALGPVGGSQGALRKTCLDESHRHPDTVVGDQLDAMSGKGRRTDESVRTHLAADRALRRRRTEHIDLGNPRGIGDGTGRDPRVPGGEVVVGDAVCGAVEQPGIESTDRDAALRAQDGRSAFGTAHE